MEINREDQPLDEIELQGIRDEIDEYYSMPDTFNYTKEIRELNDMLEYNELLISAISCLKKGGDHRHLKENKMKTTKTVNLELVFDANAVSLMGAFQEQAETEGWNKTEIDSVLTECKSKDYDNLVGVLLEHCEIKRKKL